jgi:hypothetical protein
MQRRPDVVELATELERVCLSCGSGRQLEQNEPAGRWNEKRVYVFQCVRCHRIHTDRQARFGIDLAREGDRSRPDVLWALLAGLSAVLAQTVRGECECLEPRALAVESGARALMHAVDLIAGEGELRHPGPDPIANDRKTETIRRLYGDAAVARRQMEAVGEQPPDVERARVAGFLTMLSDLFRVLAELEPALAKDAATVAQIAANPDRVFDALERMRAAGTLAPLIEFALSPSPLARKLLALQHRQDLSSLGEDGASAVAASDQMLELLTELAKTG